MPYIPYLPSIQYHTPTTPQGGHTTGGVEGGTVLWLNHDHGRGGFGTLDHIYIYYIYTHPIVHNRIYIYIHTYIYICTTIYIITNNRCAMVINPFSEGVHIPMNPGFPK